MMRSRGPQYTISMKVNKEQKTEFARRCNDAGISRTEMAARCLFGRLPDEEPLALVAREHVSFIHYLRAAIAAGHPIDAAAVESLTEVTRELVSAVRLNLAG